MAKDLNEWEAGYTDGARESWEASNDNWRPDCLGDISNCRLISVMCPWNEKCMKVRDEVRTGMIKYLDQQETEGDD